MEEEFKEKAVRVKEQREKERVAREVVDNVNKKSLLKRTSLGIVNAAKQAAESAQEEPVSTEDTTEDHESEEEKTKLDEEKALEEETYSAKKESKEEKVDEDDMTDEEKEALEKAKASVHAKEQREKERAAREVVDNVNKKSLLKRIGLGIVNAVKKVAYVALTPVRWIGDRVIELTMPKESRTKMYNEAIQNAYDEQKKKQEAASREDGHTIAKKMKILNNKKLTDHERMLELSKLCYDTKRTIYVKTQEGAFKFERSGDSVLISHANPMKRTLESQATYTFRAIGGVTFNKLGAIKNKEVDIRDAVEQIRMDKGFDKHTRELEKNVILESDIITDVEKSANQKDLANKEQVDKNILEGNKEEVEKAILDMTAVDKEEKDHEEKFQKDPKTIIVGNGTEYKKAYEIQLIEPEDRKPYRAIDIEGTLIDVRDIDHLDYILKNDEPEEIKQILQTVKSGTAQEKENVMQFADFGHYTFSHDEDSKVREAVVRSAIDGKVTQVLIDLAQDPEPSVRELIEKVTPCMVHEQQEVLRAPENDQELIDSLNEMSPEIPPVVPEITVPASEEIISNEPIPVPVPEVEISPEVPDAPEIPVMEGNKAEAKEEPINEKALENEEPEHVVVPENKPSKVFTKDGMIEQVEETETVYRDVEPPIKSPFIEKIEKMTGAARGEETTRKEIVTKEEVR